MSEMPYVDVHLRGPIKSSSKPPGKKNGVIDTPFFWVGS
jgi:hypothetical protein